MNGLAPKPGDWLMKLSAHDDEKFIELIGYMRNILKLTDAQIAAAATCPVASVQEWFKGRNLPKDDILRRKVQVLALRQLNTPLER
jgi:DNA-binding transcriptional regulator YiaG